MSLKQRVGTLEKEASKRGRSPIQSEPISAADLLTMDIPEEAAEQAYRRGYRDGMLVAFNDFAGVPEDINLDALFRWILKGPLFRWMRGAVNDDRRILPPSFLDKPPALIACKECRQDFEKQGKRLFCSERCRSRYHRRKSYYTKKRREIKEQQGE